jgi:hypothetical protein
MTRADDPPEGWVPFTKEWKGGSCYSLAFARGQAYAATHHGGILRLDARSTTASWRPVPLNAGLPLNRDPDARQPREGLARVSSVGADLVSGRVMAGGPQGVFRSDDGGESYQPTSVHETDQVTLPPSWLFCPGEHDLTVISEDELD